MATISKNGGLQTRPYFKGELSPPSSVKPLFNVLAFLLFIVMTAAFLSSHYTGISQQVQCGAVWALIAVFAIYSEFAANSRGKLHPFQVIASSLFLIGVPGLLFTPQGPTQTAFYVAYIVVMAIRLVLVFIIIPRIVLKSKTPPVYLLINWMLIASLLACLAAIIYYSSLGFHIFNRQRPYPATGAFWLTPNQFGFYGTFAVYTAVLSDKIKPVLKYSCIVFGLYLILVTQSRGALVVIVGALIINYGLLFIENPSKYSLRLILGGSALAVLSVVGFITLKDLPMFEGIMKRVEASDITTGRLDYATLALEVWRDSPLFGYGFTGIQIDNAYITFMLETGIVGLTAYLFVFSLIIIQGWRHFRHSGGASKLLGKAVLVMGFAIFVRGFTENTSFMMITDLQSNAYCIFASLAFLVPIGSHKEAGQKRILFRTHVKNSTPSVVSD